MKYVTRSALQKELAKKDPPMKLHYKSVIAANLLYLMFMKELAHEADKLAFLDQKVVMDKKHVKAASRKVLDKYSYVSFRKKQNAVSEGDSSPTRAN